MALASSVRATKLATSEAVNCLVSWKSVPTVSVEMKWAREMGKQLKEGAKKLSGDVKLAKCTSGRDVRSILAVSMNCGDFF